jgi:hypothetical protein
VLAAADFVAWSVALRERLKDAREVTVAAERLARRRTAHARSYSVVLVRRLAVGHILGAIRSRVVRRKAAAAALGHGRTERRLRKLLAAAVREAATSIGVPVAFVLILFFFGLHVVLHAVAGLAVTRRDRHHHDCHDQHARADNQRDLPRREAVVRGPFCRSGSSIH